MSPSTPALEIAMDELVGRMIASTTFVLPKPTIGRWFGLNPYLRPLPIPLWLSKTFPEGRYEIGIDDDATRWRYLGPHFSTHGKHIVKGNQLVPVGFKGDFAFGGQWVPGGRSVKPSDFGMEPIPAFDAHHAQYLAGQRREYDQQVADLHAGRISKVLSWMVYVSDVK